MAHPSADIANRSKHSFLQNTKPLSYMPSYHYQWKGVARRWGIFLPSQIQSISFSLKKRRLKKNHNEFLCLDCKNKTFAEQPPLASWDSIHSTLPERIHAPAFVMAVYQTENWVKSSSLKEFLFYCYWQRDSWLHRLISPLIQWTKERKRFKLDFWDVFSKIRMTSWFVLGSLKFGE